MLSEARHNQLLSALEKLLIRKYEMQETRKNFVSHLVQTAQTYELHFRKSYDSVNGLMDEITIINLTSDKCDQIRRYAKTMRSLCQSFRKQVLDNILSLHKLEQDQKADNRVQGKYDELLKSEKQFYKAETDYNRSYTQYQRKGQILNGSIKHMAEVCNDPLKFYDGKLNREDLNQLELGYNDVRTLEQFLQTQFQVLLQKDKYLSQVMFELQDKFTILSRKDVVLILEAARVIIDFNDDQNMQEIDRTENYDDIGQNQMQKYDEIYSGRKVNVKRRAPSSQGVEQFLEDFQDFFGSNSRQGNSSSKALQVQQENQFALLESRCLTVKNKLVKNMELVITQRKLIIKELKYQQDLQVELQKGVDKCRRQTLSKNCQQHIDNHKRMFQRCFGQNLFQVEQLVLNIIDYKNKSFTKFGIIIENNKDKLQTLIEEEQQSMVNYEQTVQRILSEHRRHKNRMVQSGSSAEFQAYKQNCLHTFTFFKKRFNQLNAQRRRRDSQFDQILMNLTKHLKSIALSTKSQILNQQAERYNVYVDIKPINEVINLMKNDDAFEILFKEGFFLQYNEKFKTIIEKDEYEEVRKLLEKKNQIHLTNKVRPKKDRGIACVPCRTKNLPVEADKQAYVCKLITEKVKSIKGQISIEGKQVHFQKDANFLQSRMSLFIPTSDLIKLQKVKTAQQDSTQILVLETPRGLINIKSAHLGPIQQLLRPFVGTIINPLDSQSGLSMLRGSKESILRKSHVNSSNSVQKVVSYYETPPTTAVNITTAKTNNLTMSRRDPVGDVAKLLETANYFQGFKQIEQKKVNENTFKFKYYYKQSYIHYYVKEVRRINVAEGAKIFINLQWKISFEELSLLKSYKHSQKINIYYSSSEMPRIQFIEERRNMLSQNYSQKSLYSQIQKMNKTLADDVTNIFQKNIELYFKHESMKEDTTHQIIEQDDQEDIEKLFHLAKMQHEKPFLSNTTAIAGSRIARNKSSLELGLEGLADRGGQSRISRITNRSGRKHMLAPQREPLNIVVKPPL